jgi:MoaA/NifB/PqqE/SkfB family radical SAM enzyme
MLSHQAFSFFIQWHLTERCNLRCTHCYQSGTCKDEKPFSEIKRAMGDVKQTIEAWEDAYGLEFSLSYNVTGGEPFLRQDLFDVLQEIRNTRGDIYLLTNGTLVTPDAARKLAGHGVKGVQVSIEGPEAVHDRIRGKGSFSKALSGIEHLLDAGMPVTLNATLSRINADHLMDFVALASRLGVPRLGFSRLVPAGRGRGMLSEMLEPQEVKRLYEAAFSAHAPGLEIVTGDPVASQMQGDDGEDLGDTPIGGCAAGVSGLTFLPDGTITPCRRLPIPIGNIREDLLREVWATSGVLNQLRDRSRYSGSCGRCVRWANCRGCRAIGYVYAQSQGRDDFLADDPQCFIEQGPGSRVMEKR